MLTEKRRRGDSIALTRSLLIAVRWLYRSWLALSGASRQLSQRESLYIKGELHHVQTYPMDRHPLLQRGAGAAHHGPPVPKKISDLAAAGLVSEKSRVLFVNDGSRDATWSLIQRFAAEDEHFIGISQSRNRGHQNAVLAGLMEALHSGSCDITISIDCDGQDDINAMDEMVKKYLAGAEVVYGVRSRRDTDTFFKRFTAEGFYHVMNALGADIVFNHADYRLISTRVLESFADYREVNIFLRGMVPLVGYPSDTVYYERHERLAGESHYPLRKMLALAFDGITSLSNKPIRLITGAGIVVSLISFIGVLWAIVQAVRGSVVAGWASTICIVCFMGGVQLVCLGVIGEYVGKIYMETKARPRYIISERTWAPYERKYHG